MIFEPSGWPVSPGKPPCCFVSPVAFRQLRSSCAFIKDFFTEIISRNQFKSSKPPVIPLHLFFVVNLHSARPHKRSLLHYRWHVGISIPHIRRLHFRSSKPKLESAVSGVVQHPLLGINESSHFGTPPVSFVCSLHYFS